MGILRGYMQILNTNIQNKLQLFKIILDSLYEECNIQISEPFTFAINSA